MEISLFGTYRIVQKFDKKHIQNFDQQNFNEVIIGFMEKH